MTKLELKILGVLGIGLSDMPYFFTFQKFEKVNRDD